MSTTREALREAVALAIWDKWRVSKVATALSQEFTWDDLQHYAAHGSGACGMVVDLALAEADAALAGIIPACQEAIRERGPATQDMRSTEICEALDGAADVLAAFLPGGNADG